MRKEYDFSRGVRLRLMRTRRSGTSTRVKNRPTDPDNEPLHPAFVRELRRRIADHDDPTRYLLVSRFGPRHALYYNVSDNVYVMNHPERATLFKRRQAALAVKRLLGSNVEIVRCTTRRHKDVRVPVLPKFKLRHRGSE